MPSAVDFEGQRDVRCRAAGCDRGGGSRACRTGLPNVSQWASRAGRCAEWEFASSVAWRSMEYRMAVVAKSCANRDMEITTGDE